MHDNSDYVWCNKPAKILEMHLHHLRGITVKNITIIAADILRCIPFQRLSFDNVVHTCSNNIVKSVQILIY